MEIKKKRFLILFLIFTILVSFAMVLSSCSILFKKGDGEQVALNFCRYEFDEENFVYDGTEKKITIYIYNIDGNKIETLYPDKENSDIEVEYEDNINAGIAKANVRAKDGSTKYKSGWVVEFNIARAEEVFVDNQDDLILYASSNNYNTVKITKDIYVDKRLSIYSNVNLKLQGHTLEIDAYVNNSGIIDLSGNSTMYCFNSFSNSTGGLLICNDQSSIYLNRVDYSSSLNIRNDYKDKIKVYERSSVYPYLSTSSYDYTGGEIKPTVNISGCSLDVDYDVKYENNVNVGIASITVTAKRYSKLIYGTKTINFEIKPTMKYATSVDELNAILEDKNNTLITLSGTFPSLEIKEGYTVTASNLTVNGTLTISGELTTSGSGLTANGDVILNGKFTNNGVFNSQHSILVNNMASILNNNKFMLKGDLVNNGNVSTTSNMFLLGAVSGYKITSTSPGVVISDKYIGNYVNGRYTQRTQANDTNVYFLSSTFYYLGVDRIPTLKFENRFVGTADCSIVKHYRGEDSTSSFIKPGIVDWEITFNEDSPIYTGSITISYEILRGIYEISSSNADNDLDNAILDLNYGTYLIGGKQTYSEVTFSRVVNIPKTATMKVENALVVFNSSVEINGELNITQNGNAIVNDTITVIGNLDDNGYNDGQINNNKNLVFPGEDGNQIILQSGGVINNNSSVYFNAISQASLISGDGNVYTRLKIDDNCIQNLAESVEYNTLNRDGVKPSFDLVVNGDYILNDGAENFVATYTNNTAPNSIGRLTVYGARYSTNVYGSATKTFSITKGEVIVTGSTIYTSSGSKRDLEYALENHTKYTKIVFGANIGYSATAQVTGSVNITITIPEGAIVDCGDYAFNFNLYTNSKYSSSGSFKIENSGTLIMRKPITGVHQDTLTTGGISTYDIKQKLHLNGNGQYLGEAYSSKDLADLVPFCKEINVMQNLSQQPGYSYLTAKTYFHNCTIDLQGYTVNQAFYVDILKKSLTITSTDSKGTIGVSGAAYAVWLKEATDPYVLTLNNLYYVNGYKNDKSSARMSVTNCSQR